MKRPTTAPGGSIPLKSGSLDYSSRSLIMGVINVTPDSFSDGGRFYDPIVAIQHGTKLVHEGADILDIGGESTRPGAEPVPAAEELERILPVIQGLTQEVKVPIAVDTYKAEVAGRALEAGATIVNDTSALRFDSEMADVVAQHQAAVVLMHMKGTPRDMQQNPYYDDLLHEVYTFLQQRIEKAQDSGISPEKIIIDPGIGFGKTYEHNLLLIKHLSHFHSLRKPILLGTSRKSFIGQVLGTPVDEREEGTAASVAIGIWNGAQIIRVHDVRPAVRVARVTDALLRVEL